MDKRIRFQEPRVLHLPTRADGWESSRIARFSTEIALTPEDKFVAVDYINDSIDLRAQSKAVDGVPDIILWYIAYALVGLVKKRKSERKK